MSSRDWLRKWFLRNSFSKNQLGQEVASHESQKSSFAAHESH